MHYQQSSFLNIDIIIFLQGLTVKQLKTLSQIIDDTIKKTNEERQHTEEIRNNKLGQIGNLLHQSVPVSNDEVNSMNIITVQNVHRF